MRWQLLCAWRSRGISICEVERFDEWVFAVRFEPTGQLNITCSRSLVKLSYADASQHQSWKLLTDSPRVEITKKVFYEQFLFLFFIAVARRVSLFIVEEKWVQVELERADDPIPFHRTNLRKLRLNRFRNFGLRSSNGEKCSLMDGNQPIDGLSADEEDCLTMSEP